MQLLIWLIILPIVCGCNVLTEMRETTHAIQENRQAIMQANAGIAANLAEVENSTEAITRNKDTVAASTHEIAANQDAIHRTNQAILENLQVIEESTKAILENQKVVLRSNIVIQKNADLIEKVNGLMESLNVDSRHLGFFLILIVFFLLVPSLLMSVMMSIFIYRLKLIFKTINKH
jgi:methyl-accepting chemotaxis protein